MTNEEFGGSDVAMGMANWGYGEPNEDGSTITGNSGTEYLVTDVTTLDFWNEYERCKYRRRC